VPKAADLERDDLQSGPMLRAERIDPAQRLLDVLNPHGNMPPVKNAGHRLASGRTDQATQCCFAVADNRHGLATLPSLFAERLAQRRQRGFRTLGRKSKPPGRLPCYFDFANCDVDMLRLIAGSGSDALRRSGRPSRLPDRFQAGVSAAKSRGARGGRDTMGSVAHGGTIHGVARQEHGQ
jgi:hypothetical protein